MSLADHFRAIVANWWRILLFSVVVATLVFAYSRTRPEVFRAETMLSVAGGDIAGATFDENQLYFRAAFYAAISETRPIAQAVADSAQGQRLGLDVEEVEGAYSASTTETSGLILIRAEGESPEVAFAIASGVAEALGDDVVEEQEQVRDAQALALQTKIVELERTKRGLSPDSTEYAVIENALALSRAAAIELETQELLRLETVAPALAEDEPVSPQPARDALFGFMLAFVFSSEAAVALRAFSDRFARSHDAAAISEFTGLPVLAMVPRGRGPEVVEAFRTLRTNLLFLEGAGRPRTIAVVSPNPGSGKSFCAISLAESAVAVDTDVVLVDADLRRPVVHSRLRIPREPGLSDALRGTDLGECLHPVEGHPGLSALPSGAPVGDTVGVLGGRAFRQILDSLDSAQLVVVDTPPGTVYADALAVSAQCDATLLVLDAKSTRQRPARQMIESLERTGATLIGVVVNNTQFSRRDSYERT